MLYYVVNVNATYKKNRDAGVLSYKFHGDLRITIKISIRLIINNINWEALKDD